MMTQFEIEQAHNVRTSLRTIADELKRANRLKALELRFKLKNEWHSSEVIREIDDIME